MTPKIQHDETLSSFLTRVIYLKSMRRETSKLRSTLSMTGDSTAAKMVATLSKWPGCFGFNQALHNHTRFSLDGIFSDGFDISYSQKRYGSRSFMGSPWQNPTSYCPSCVREDLEKLGFSYWRRTHDGDVTVCWKHNVVLLTSCHFCGAAFTSNNCFHYQIAVSRARGNNGTSIPSRLVHGPEIMWEGCSQKALSDVAPKINSDSTALLKARFYNDALNFGHLIPLEPALRTVQRKFKALESQGFAFKNACGDHIRAQRRILDRLDLLRPGQERAFSYNGAALIETAMAVYETFTEFLADVRLCDSVLRPVQSLWSTYISEGYESVHYIEEHYATGVGVWSCPNPSIRSLDPASRDGARAQRVWSYPCCNMAKVVDSKRNAATKARVGFPKIPHNKGHIELIGSSLNSVSADGEHLVAS